MEKGSFLPEMAGAGGKDGVEQALRKDITHGYPDGSGHGRFYGILPDLHEVEGSEGVHHSARYDRHDAFRLLAADPAGIHNPDFSEDTEPFRGAVRPDPFLPFPNRCGYKWQGQWG